MKKQIINKDKIENIEINNSSFEKLNKNSIKKRNEEITIYDTDELTKFKLILSKSHPFYSNLLTYINIYYSDYLETAGIFISESTLKPVIIINKDFFDKLIIENKIAILEHELWHLISGHITYRNYKELEEDKTKQLIWNIAYDIAINQFIKNLPNDDHPTYIKFGFPPNLSCEQYFELLIKKLPKIEIIILNDIGENTEEGAGEDSNNTIKINLLDTHKGWSSSLSDDNKEKLKEKLKEIFIKVKNNSCSIGKESQDFISHFDSIFESKVNWVNELRRFIAKNINSNRIISLKKRNKRFKMEPYIIPGFKRNKKLDLIVTLDTSGSISDKQFAAFVSELINLKKLNYEITVIECDTEIKNIYKFDDYTNVTFKGRGGTSFVKPFMWVQEKTPKPDAMIYFTDMQGVFPDIDLKFPTLWVSTTDKNPYWDKINFGDIIYIDPVEC